MIVAAALLLLAVQATPAPAPAWVWSLYERDAEVALAHEIPDTDKLDAVFQCQPGSGEVKMTLYALAGGGQTAELGVGEARTQAPLADRKDHLVARLAVNDPVFQALVKAGKLSVKAEGGEALVNVPPDKLQQLARRCGS